MSTRPRLLVVAAWEPELARFRARLAADRSTDPRAPEIVLDTLGVGVVEAAVGMTRSLLRHAPDLALLLGTAGALPREPGDLVESADRPRIGDVVSGSSVRLVDGTGLDGRSQLPPPLPSSCALDVDLHAVLVSAGARSVQIANTVGITVDDALARRLGEATDDVEHLEAFGFARACATLDVPAVVCLGIANDVGARGRGEGLANHVSASARAADVAFDALAGLAGLVASLRTRTKAPSPGRA